jgi:hypothetical protein
LLCFMDVGLNDKDRNEAVNVQSAAKCLLYVDNF